MVAVAARALPEASVANGFAACGLNVRQGVERGVFGAEAVALAEGKGYYDPSANDESGGQVEGCKSKWWVWCEGCGGH